MPTDPTPPLTAVPPFRTYTADGDGRPTLVAYTELYEWANRAAVQVAALTAEVEALRINLRASNNEVAGFYNAALLADERCEKLTAANYKMRHWLWVTHDCPFGALYGDDGEMSCGNCIGDWKREPIEKLLERAGNYLRTLTAALARRTEEGDALRGRFNGHLDAIATAAADVYTALNKVRVALAAPEDR